MMSDRSIVRHILRSGLRAFSEPRSRREIAHRLRDIRNTAGRHAARLVQQECARVWIDVNVKGE